MRRRAARTSAAHIRAPAVLQRFSRPAPARSSCRRPRLWAARRVRRGPQARRLIDVDIRPATLVDRASSCLRDKQGGRGAVEAQWSASRPPPRQRFSFTVCAGRRRSCARHGHRQPPFGSDPRGEGVPRLQPSRRRASGPVWLESLVRSPPASPTMMARPGWLRVAATFSRGSWRRSWFDPALGLRTRLHRGSRHGRASGMVSQWLAAGRWRRRRSRVADVPSPPGRIVSDGDPAARGHGHLQRWRGRRLRAARSLIADFRVSRPHPLHGHQDLRYRTHKAAPAVRPACNVGALPAAQVRRARIWRRGAGQALQARPPLLLSQVRSA